MILYVLVTCLQTFCKYLPLICEIHCLEFYPGVLFERTLSYKIEDNININNNYLLQTFHSFTK